MGKTKAKSKMSAKSASARPAPPAAVVPRSIIEQAKAFTAPRGRLEMGGLLFGHVDGEGRNVCVVGLFPKQTEASPGYCEFEGKWMAVAAAAAGRANDSVQDPEGGSETPTIRVIGWIHTHPGLDIFLSGIDVATYRQNMEYSPDGRFIAVVVDPLMGKDGVFLTPNKPNTYSSASGIAILDGILRERYLAFLAEIEAVRDRVGRDEIPFVISGDLSRDHVARGFNDDYMQHNFDSIHSMKLDLNSAQDAISDLSEDLGDIRDAIKEIGGEVVKLRREIALTNTNEGEIKRLHEGAESFDREFVKISQRIEELREFHDQSAAEQRSGSKAATLANKKLAERVNALSDEFVKLRAWQDHDRDNANKMGAKCARLEGDLEIQRKRNVQLGAVVERIGSQARVTRASRKQMEHEGWDELHRKLNDADVSNMEILNSHFALIAMNQQFCGVAFKRIRGNGAAPSEGAKAGPGQIADRYAKLRDSVGVVLSSLFHR